MHTKKLHLLLMFVILSLYANVSRAEFLTSLTAEVTSQQNGIFLYEYLLTNEAGSTLPAVEFVLTVPETANLQNISGPENWEITYAAGDFTVAWGSSQSATDIQPGQTAKFSFTTHLPAGVQDYGILGLNTDPFALEENQGTIAGPVSVIPEPSALLQMGIGLLGLTGFGWWHRRRKRSQASAG